jgi:hypothetical protein
MIQSNISSFIFVKHEDFYKSKMRVNINFSKIPEKLEIKNDSWSLF